MRNNLLLIFLLFFSGLFFSGVIFSQSVTPGKTDDLYQMPAIPEVRKSYTFPVEGVARYYLKSATQKGEQTTLKITLRDDFYSIGEEVYMTFVAYDKGTMMDLWILNSWRLYSRVYIPYSITQIMSLDLNIVMQEAAKVVDWDLVLPTVSKQYYRRLGYMISTIENRLPLVVKESSVANSLGFAKWVVDGLYLEKRGEEIPISFLNQKAYEERGGRHVLVFEEKESPFVALDWCRNLALAVSLIGDPKSKYGDDDVNSFSFFKYSDDLGYELKDLQRLLYMLAVTKPNSFFLGSLNQNDEALYDVRRHDKIFIFFPRINYKGELEVTVFSEGQKIELNQIVSENGDALIHLVELSADDAFAPGKYEIYSVLKR